MNTEPRVRRKRTAMNAEEEASLEQNGPNGSGAPEEVTALETQQAELPAVAECASLPEASFPRNSKAVVVLDPASLAAEQYRVLRTKLMRIQAKQALRVILVASPGLGDGKTTTALNLALALAQKPDTRVLLVEADMRKPAISPLLGLPLSPGLSEYLSEEARWEEIFRRFDKPRFSVLSSGRPTSSAADLLQMPRLASLMRAVREQFDWVILDGPPVCPVADHQLLSPYSDGILLVIRPGHTQRDLWMLTAESINQKKVLGVVVNATESFERYGGYYGYGYGGVYGRVAPPADNTSRLAAFRRSAERLTGAVWEAVRPSEKSSPPGPDVPAPGPQAPVEKPARLSALRRGAERWAGAVREAVRPSDRPSPPREDVPEDGSGAPVEKFPRLSAAWRIAERLTGAVREALRFNGTSSTDSEVSEGGSPRAVPTISGYEPCNAEEATATGKSFSAAGATSWNGTREAQDGGASEPVEKFPRFLAVRRSAERLAGAVRKAFRSNGRPPAPPAENKAQEQAEQADRAPHQEM